MMIRDSKSTYIARAIYVEPLWLFLEPFHGY